eukprot:1857959-Pyramimonas_sp.AAC.1
MSSRPAPRPLLRMLERQCVRPNTMAAWLLVIVPIGQLSRSVATGPSEVGPKYMLVMPKTTER